MEPLCPGELRAAAEQLRGEVLPALEQLAFESSRPELRDALALLALVPDKLDLVDELFCDAIGRVEGYIERQGGLGASSVATRPVGPTQPGAGDVRPSTRVVDEELIAEARRAGVRISPGRVLRIGRDGTGRIVWLEEGDEQSGARHILKKERVTEFAGMDIPQGDIIDVVWQAVLSGNPLGISGKDRVVYETTYRGRRKLIAVTVGSNGYLIGANPISEKRKLKPL
ncbi:hypothetical protein [Goodfellowiella coeruleoviolacea]|uniref:hypothetical protein n=1 Tax=Goodfellowiella coeruleoviolacea TaxID=334858 RepID=UPI0020A479C1|nr:hypothetical protein [Goodfellowiella coeruleoviolacea]